MPIASPPPARGDIWLADLNPVRGHEQAGRRPVLVVSVDLFNQGRADLVVVLPVTSTIRAPFHFTLPFLSRKAASRIHRASCARLFARSARTASSSGGAPSARKRCAKSRIAFASCSVCNTACFRSGAADTWAPSKRRVRRGVRKSFDSYSRSVVSKLTRGDDEFRSFFVARFPYDRTTITLGRRSLR